MRWGMYALGNRIRHALAQACAGSGMRCGSAGECMRCGSAGECMRCGSAGECMRCGRCGSAGECMRCGRCGSAVGLAQVCAVGLAQVCAVGLAQVCAVGLELQQQKKAHKMCLFVWGMLSSWVLAMEYLHPR